MVVLLAAVLVSKSCGKTDPDISQDQAIAIAERQVPFDPNKVVIRFQKRGVQQREYWLVGLGIIRSDGSYEKATNVLVDATTGEVADVQEVPQGG